MPWIEPQDRNLLMLQAFMGGLAGRNDGFADALQTGLALREKRRAETAQTHTLGALQELLGGTRDFSAIFGKYGMADPDIFGLMLRETLKQEEEKRARSSAMEDFGLQRDRLKEDAVAAENRAATREREGQAAEASGRVAGLDELGQWGLVERVAPGPWASPADAAAALPGQMLGALEERTAQEKMRATAEDKAADNARLEAQAQAAARRDEANLEIQRNRLKLQQQRQARPSNPKPADVARARERVLSAVLRIAGSSPQHGFDETTLAALQQPETLTRVFEYLDGLEEGDAKDNAVRTLRSLRVNAPAGPLSSTASAAGKSEALAPQGGPTAMEQDTPPVPSARRARTRDGRMVWVVPSKDGAGWDEVR